MSDKRNYLVTVICYAVLNDDGTVASTTYRTTPMFSSVDKQAAHTAAMAIPVTAGKAMRTTMTTFRAERTHNDQEIIDTAIASGVFDEQSVNVLKGRMAQADERDIALAKEKAANTELQTQLDATLARLRALEEAKQADVKTGSRK